jgi:hypothetical protein
VVVAPSASGSARHEGVSVAVAREAAALDGIPDQDVAYEDALAEVDTASSGRRSGS